MNSSLSAWFKKKNAAAFSIYAYNHTGKNLCQPLAVSKSNSLL